MKHINYEDRKKGRKVFRPRKKAGAEEDAAIQFLQAQYDKINPDEIKTFKDFPLSQKTLRGLTENNYKTPTEIQRQVIGLALQGKDILGAARTGSGKTLAFLIPILEHLFIRKWTRLDGTGAMVISPTRELAYQIYECLRKVGRFHDFSAGLIIGGQNLKFERKRMDRVNILICTPGRLLQHMDENPLFDCNPLQLLVLDEADRCLDLGFQDTMNAIIQNLPLQRQTLLFSATQTSSVRDLVRLSLQHPEHVAPHEQAATVTPETLQQSYIICDIHEKLGILWSFIKNHLKQKILVFMASCKQVKYTYELFCRLRPGVSLLALYGSLHQAKREAIYHDFCRKSNVVLFATDLASRGLDFPKVNWVIQMDCPEDADTYIHRAGRTARGVSGKGEGLLVLLPHEEKIVPILNRCKIPINKIAVDPSKVQAPLRKIEALLSEVPELKQSAQRAFVSYIKSVFVMKNKDIFDISLLDTAAYARSLGLIVPPTVRFLQKHQYRQKQVPHATSDNFTKKIDSIDFKVSQVLSDDEELLKPKMNTILGAEEVEVTDIAKPRRQKKPLTKAAIAKKLLKRNVKVNTKVTFTEEGDTVQDEKAAVRSQVGKQLMEEQEDKLDIEKSMLLLREEDKYDKQRFREKVKARHRDQKRKLKEKQEEVDYFGSEPESDGPDLSWLPDPDKLYRNEEQTLDDHDSEETLRGSKRSPLPDAGGTQPKKRKQRHTPASLTVHEAEQLAMQLLHK